MAGTEESPYEAVLRKERQDMLQERMEIIERVSALEGRLAKEVARLDKRADHASEWMKTLDGRVTEIQNTQATILMPLLRQVSDNVSSVGRAVKTVAKGQEAQNQSMQEMRGLIAKTMDTLQTMQGVQSEQFQQLVSLRSDHEQDHKNVTAAIETHKKSESLLTKAGLLMGGLWATATGLVVFIVYTHGWPWAKAIIIHYLERGNP